MIGKELTSDLFDGTDTIARSIAAKLTSPAEGVYSIHPRQIITRMPLNIDDVDLIDGITPVEKPMSYPTDMAYFLQRCRLGEVSRHIVDRTSLIMSRSSEPNREDIMDVDTELQTLANDMPGFLSMSQEQLMATYNFNSMRAAAISQQGHIARFLIHAQRCRLHLPYFTRGFADMTHSQSKEICLSSARQVLLCGREFISCPPLNHYRFCAIFIGLLMSSIVLLMDFCINRTSSHRDRQRKDAAEAFRLLQEGRKESDGAARFVDSLMQILKKHNLPPLRAASNQAGPNERGCHHQIHTPPADGAVLGRSYASIRPNSLARQSPSSSFTVDTGTDTTLDWTNDDVDLTSYFDDLSQTFEVDTDVDSINWDSLLSDFGMSIVGTA